MAARLVHTYPSLQYIHCACPSRVLYGRTYSHNFIHLFIEVHQQCYMIKCTFYIGKGVKLDAELFKGETKLALN